MENSIFIKFARSIAALGVLAFSGSLLAAGPLAVCNSGEPFLWPGGGANVPFNPDQGNLGILDNAQATQAVSDAFQAWEDVPSATINYTNASQLPVDVDVTNFVPFLQPVAPDGLSAIVFDDSGEIFELIFGPGSGILGFAGPEWINGADCSILEGVSFLNGPAINSLEGLLDLMVHEFGHYSNLAHTTVNGQLFIGEGDTSGPGSDNTFGSPPFPDGIEIIETMYPFLFTNIDQIARTPNADDIASISQLYPEADFLATTGTISGTIFSGGNKVTGVNVIARNINDPFFDAVSGISSDFTDDFSQDNPFTGLYRINGLTPGAQYAVYVDEILDGGFSTPLASPLPGPEEFYNGGNESSDGALDIPNEFVALDAAAGIPVEGIDILFNLPQPGEPLATGDDGNVEIPLPFEYCVAGQAYSSVFINGNGFLTFGSADESLTFIESAADFIGGPPRIAGYWDDLNPNDGGVVFYEQTNSRFSVTWDSVPEFTFSGTGGGSNTFTVAIGDNSPRCIKDAHSGDSGLGGVDVKITHGALSSNDGLVGVSTGAFSTSGFETEVDLSEVSDDGKRSLSLKNDAAVFELFSFSNDDVDIANGMQRFKEIGEVYKDRFKDNNIIARAGKIELPFNSINTQMDYTSIAPSAADIDFFRFKNRLRAGQTVVAEVLTGQVDTVMGIFRCNNDVVADDEDKSKVCTVEDAELVAFNDDSNGLLSRIVYEVPQDGTYALAVTFCCDFDFDGIDPGQGEPFDEGRYVLDVFSVDGILLELTDDSFTELELGFDFPYQGVLNSSVFVHSNGFVSFGEGGRTDFSPSVDEWLDELPRIAPLWTDLSPNVGGTILAKRNDGSITIDYVDVPEFFVGGSNTFSLTLSDSGEISITYAGLTAPEGITGTTLGGGTTGTAVDLSSATNWPATGTTFEEFDEGVSDFDLDGSTLTFDP